MKWSSLPIWAARMQPYSSSDPRVLTEYIGRQAQFSCGLKYENLSGKTIRSVKRILLDSIGCIAAGVKEMPVTGVENSGNCTVIGEQNRFSREWAACIQGTAMVKNELDEGNQFAFGHPACHFIPALLAQADFMNTDTRAFIEAFVAAYELTARWSRAAKLLPHVHIHGTVGTAGACAAVTKLKRYQPEAVVESILLACSLPLPTSWDAAFAGKEIRNAYVGISNAMGMAAADMYQMGIRSGTEVLQSVLCRTIGSGIDLDQLTAGLDEEFLIEKNYMKIYSACRYIHSIADVVTEWVKSGFRYQDLKEMKIETYSAAAKLNGKTADNLFAAKFSIPVSIALLLCTGSLEKESLKESFVRDQTVNEIAQKIYVVESGEFTALLPDIRANRITVETVDGKVMVEQVNQAKGDYTCPLSQGEIEEKFHSLTKKVWSGEVRERMIDSINRLEELKGMGELIVLLRG